MKIAVIPARGGSKRIPRKNIKKFIDKPMIAWSIIAAKKSNVFDHVLVSTDDKEIAEIAREYGAEVPFIRPKELSDDYTGTTEVIAHAASWALVNLGPVEAVCCIYATAPFVQPEDIEGSLKELLSNDWLYSFSVTEYPAPIFRSFKYSENGGIDMLYPEHFKTRSQDLVDVFHDAGQFYWGRPEAWIENELIFGEKSKPYFIPRWRVQDIDTMDDWIRAESIAKSITKFVR